MITAVEGYLLHLRRAGRASSTVAIRRRSLMAFVAWLTAQGVVSWPSVTQAHVRAYIKALMWTHYTKTQRLRSPWTQHIDRVSLRLFFRYLQEQGFLLWNPACDLSAPTGSRIPKVVLTVGEMEALLSVIDLTNPVGIRDRAILEFLYTSGLRIGELLSLLVSDMDLKEGILTVRKGKGGRSRRVPLGEEAIQWLLRYLSEVRPRWALRRDPGALWLSKKGTPLEAPALSARLKLYAEMAGISKPITAHTLRHTFATHMLEGGADVRHVQELLGHSRVDTTQIYLHRTSMGLAQTLKECHPRSRLSLDGGPKKE